MHRCVVNCKIKHVGFKIGFRLVHMFVFDDHKDPYLQSKISSQMLTVCFSQNILQNCTFVIFCD